MGTRRTPDRRTSPAGDDFCAQYRRALEKGDLTSCYQAIPKLGVAKDKRILPMVKECLFSGDRQKEELAVCCLGALGASEGLEWIYRKLRDESTYRGKGSHRLQTALVEAIGEIGDDQASPVLMEFFANHFARDNFRRDRRLSIVDALGNIAQQDGVQALEKLALLLEDPDFLVRSQVVNNICTAFWHRPDDIPEVVFTRLLGLLRDSHPCVQHTVLSALENLAKVGCGRASALFAD